MLLPTFMGGATFPVWGPRIGIEAVVRWCRLARSYHALRPLWSALRQAAPSVAFDPTGTRIRPGNLALARYRRVIEIWDARLRLRPYLDPAWHRHALELGQAAGLSGRSLQAAAEAGLLMAAMDASDRGEPGTVSDPAAPAFDGPDEVWLVAVSRAFAKSSVPVALCAELHRSARSQPQVAAHLDEQVG